ncbi:MAG: abortive phage infection protein, partial [Opitutales bacterium]
MIKLDYPDVLDNFRRHIVPGRSESASFLIWYLENYYRLDEGEAVDSVCDQGGDKGVDGIFVNDNDATITIFQAKMLQNNKKT